MTKSKIEPWEIRICSAEPHEPYHEEVMLCHENFGLCLVSANTGYYVNIMDCVIKRYPVTIGQLKNMKYVIDSALLANKDMLRMRKNELARERRKKRQSK